jgi:hypothetical protein
MNCELCRSEMPQHLRRPIETLSGVRESVFLEKRILVGLRQERARTKSRRRRQWVWLRPHSGLRSNWLGHLQNRSLIVAIKL